MNIMSHLINIYKDTLNYEEGNQTAATVHLDTALSFYYLKLYLNIYTKTYIYGFKRQPR